jgi:AcrR family transcriptional regulator
MANLNRPKQFEVSREEFITAAREVFNQKGFHAASVDDIAIRAGRSKGGFYHHFQSKDQLYLEVFETLLRDSLARLQEGMKSGASIRDVLDNLIVEFEPMMKNREKMIGAIEFVLQALRNESAAKTLKAIHVNLVDALSSLLTLASQRGELRSDAEFRLIAEVRIASGRGISITMLLCDECHRIPELLRAQTELTLNGLAERHRS